MEKCRRYALNAAWSGQKALTAEDARDAWKYFFYEVRPLFLDLRYQLDLEYLVLQHPEVQDAYLAQTIAAFETARKRPRRTDFKHRMCIAVMFLAVEYANMIHRIRRKNLLICRRTIIDNDHFIRNTHCISYRKEAAFQMFPHVVNRKDNA